MQRSSWIALIFLFAGSSLFAQPTYDSIDIGSHGHSRSSGQWLSLRANLFYEQVGTGGVVHTSLDGTTYYELNSVTTVTSWETSRGSWPQNPGTMVFTSGHKYLWVRMGATSQAALVATPEQLQIVPTNIAGTVVGAPETWNWITVDLPSVTVRIDRTNLVASVIDNPMLPPDSDGDGFPDDVDPDDDNDGIPDEQDPDHPDWDEDQYPDTDGDGIPDHLDDDDDNDGIPDYMDSDHPDYNNDMDGDGIPDHEDPDRDGDGILNEFDPDPDLPFNNNLPGPDTDGDGTPDQSDPDDDNDGIPDNLDPEPGVPGPPGGGGGGPVAPTLPGDGGNAGDVNALIPGPPPWNGDKAQVHPSVQPSYQDSVGKLKGKMDSLQNFRLLSSGTIPRANSYTFAVSLGQYGSINRTIDFNAPWWQAGRYALLLMLTLMLGNSLLKRITI